MPLAGHADGVIVVAGGGGVNGDDAAFAPVIALAVFFCVDGIRNLFRFLEHVLGEGIG